MRIVFDSGSFSYVDWKSFQLGNEYVVHHKPVQLMVNPTLDGFSTAKCEHLWVHGDCYALVAEAWNYCYEIY